MATNPKFRIWATIWWGYRYTFQNTKLLIRCAAFMGPMWLILFGVVPSFSVMVLNANLDGVPDKLLEIMVGVFLLLTVAHFAVAWHRSVLLNDKRPHFLRFGSREVSYFGITFALTLMANTDDIVSSLDANMGFMSDETPIVIWVLVQVVVVLVLPILGVIIYCLVPIILPAVSIRDSKMSLDIAWKNMRGWRVRFLVFWVIQTVLWIGPFIGLLFFTRYVREPVWALLGANLEEHQNMLDIFLAMAAETLISLPPVIALVFSTGGMLAGLSIAYAGLARQALKSDRKYKPIPAFSDRLLA